MCRQCSSGSVYAYNGPGSEPSLAVWRALNYRTSEKFICEWLRVCYDLRLTAPLTSCQLPTHYVEALHKKRACTLTNQFPICQLACLNSNLLYLCVSAVCQCSKYISVNVCITSPQHNQIMTSQHLAELWVSPECYSITIYQARSHRSGWSGFDLTTFSGSLTPTHETTPGAPDKYYCFIGNPPNRDYGPVYYCLNPTCKETSGICFSIASPVVDPGGGG